MEVKEEKAMDQGGVRKIPVFTVLKNGAILKNIFIVNSPDSLSPERNGGGGGDFHEVEEILVVGRHPDCNIMLTHPSISRFHLQIRSIPSRQKLSVTDLSSVHGTWVSDQRIEPGTCVEVKEGDTIRIGGSTRHYRLHWIPLSHAYDMDNAFVSPLDLYAANEQEEENRVLKAENVEVTHEDGKLVLGKGEAPQLDWTSDGTGSSGPNEDADTIVKETSSLRLASPSELPLGGYPFEMRKLQLCEDAQALPNFVTDIVEVEAENPRTSCLAGKQQNGGSLKALGSSLFAELAEDSNNESLRREYNGETEVVSKQGMEVSAYLFAETEPLLEIKTKDIRNLALGWRPLSESQSELENEAENHCLHQEDNGETEVVSKQIMEVSAQPFTATEPLLETKTKVIQGPLLGWQPLSEIQNELAQQANYQSLHQEDDGGIDVISRQVMAVSSCSFPETEFLSETKCKDIQDPFLGWQPLSEIQSEVKPTRDQNRYSGMTVETEELYDEANNLSLCKGLEQSESWSSLSATNENPNVEQRESVLDIGCGGGSDEAYSLSEIESHQNNEKMGFVTGNLAAELSANLSQPAEEIFSDVTEGKGNQTLPSHAVRGVLSETENLRGFPLESAKRSSACCIWSSRGKSASVLQIRTKRSEGKAKRIGGNCKAHLQKKEVINDKSISPSLHAGSEKLEEIFTPDKENLTPNTHILKRLQEIDYIKESKSSSLHAGSEKLEPEIFTPDKENLTTNAHILKRLQEIGDIKESKSSVKATSRPFSLKIPLSNDIAASEAVLEPEIFTPDKENLTPNSLMLKRQQEVGKLQGNMDSSKATRKPFSSKVVFSPEIHSEENIVPVEKENQSSFCSTSSQSELKHEQVLPKRKTERVPFQTLLEKSSAKSEQRAEASNTASRNGNSRGSRPSSILSNGKRKMKWTIVVDTSSLLDRESRKSLQLLQGLKGTQLVIPRTVLRELDERKRSCGLFLRRTADVSSALEWIQECMVKTKWWVHVQSSSEEIGPTAPTPPASSSLFSDGSAFPFSQHRAAPEIVSPTSEDNVLECALLYRKRNSDGQLVLLSNDVTLEIKAMAEGIMCETAQEFHESLANPYSERFMWAESWPRGQTWTHLDDVGLRERYKTRSFPYKNSAKGLKLILLHNSHYGHNKSSSPLLPSNSNPL